MEESEDFVGFLSDVSYHLIEIGRYLVHYMMRRAMGDTLLEHRNGHVPDPYNCPYCKYEREVVEPRDASRARDAFRARRRRAPNASRDEVDVGYVADDEDEAAERGTGAPSRLETINENEQYF